jgi:hypothetical protein
MIVRTFSHADKVLLLGDSVARQLIDAKDDVGHTLVEARLPANATRVVEPDYLHTYDVQAYYVIEGEGVASLEQNDYALKPGILVAAGTDKAVSITTATPMRIAAIFCKNGVKQALVSVQDLADIHGTARDVFWGNGHSKRMLVKRDGYGFAFCVTVGNSNTDSLLQYRNNLESCYYISGTGEYDWETAKHPILTDQDEATVFIMNNYDTHHMRIHQESICLSIFTPPIEGTESHDFSSGKPSSY